VNSSAKFAVATAELAPMVGTMFRISHVTQHFLNNFKLAVTTRK